MMELHSKYSLLEMADYLGVSSSGYYEWLKRKESDRKKEGSNQV